MIVQCEHCKAKFNVADDKISAKGTSVRCSKCKTVFKVFLDTAPAPAPVAPPVTLSTPTAPSPSPFNNPFEFIQNEQIVESISMKETTASPAVVPAAVSEEADFSQSGEELFGGMEGDLSPPSAEEIGFEEAAGHKSADAKPFAMPAQPATMEFQTPVPHDMLESQPVDPMEGVLQPVAASVDHSGPHKVSSLGAGGVQLPKPIALRTVSRASALGLPTDQAPGLSKTNRLEVFSQHLIMLALLLSVLVGAMAMRGVHLWRTHELVYFMKYGFISNAAEQLLLQDYTLQTVQRVRDESPLVLVSGVLYNHSKSAVTPPKMQLFFTDKQGSELLTADLPCCLQVPIASLRETDNDIDLEALYSGNLNSKPIAAGEHRPFQLIVIPKQLPYNYKVSLLAEK